MRYANYRYQGQDFSGRIEGETVRPLNDVPPLTASFDWDAVTAAQLGEPVALSEVTLLPPVTKPGKIICLGLNYRGHVKETGRELPTYPVLFTKFSESLIGAHDPIVAPPESNRIDYEAELAVVIGRAARRLAPEAVYEHIAGFCVANDVSMRDYQYKTHQWLQGKSWPRTTPVGPWLVTGDEIDWAEGLAISLKLNGQQLQSSNTRQMIFDVKTTIARISEFVELGPGDLVLMGTPDGVGDKRDPPLHLTPGDRVRVEIEAIGAIENEVVAEHVA